jgi:hypothetical protein
MQGTIAHVVALVLEGNAALRGVSSPGLGSDHSAMTFCEYVHFADLAGTPTGWSERIVAADPAAWFRYLSERGFNELRLSHGPSRGTNPNGVPDRMLAAFIGGGGRWLIQASRPRGSDYWESRWTVGDRERADRRIWQVTYGRLARNQPPTADEPIDLQALRDELREALVRIKAFASKQGLDDFAACFANGLDDLAAPSPVHAFHKELANPSLLPVEAIQLLSAAQSAWVFGGMGSWNDLGFDGEDQSTYESLSEALYGIVNRAIVAATNASAVGSACAPDPDPGNDKPGNRPWWKLFG